MSQENVEIVKRAMDAFNRPGQEIYDELVTADFEWFPAMIQAVEGDSYRGREGAEAVRATVSDTWEDFRIVGDDFRDLGDTVLVFGRQEGRGRGSSVPVDAPIGMVFDFREGKISRCRSYLDHGEALKAAGLEE